MCIRVALAASSFFDACSNAMAVDSLAPENTRFPTFKAPGFSSQEKSALARCHLQYNFRAVGDEMRANFWAMVDETFNMRCIWGSTYQIPIFGQRFTFGFEMSLFFAHVVDFEFVLMLNGILFFDDVSYFLFKLHCPSLKLLKIEQFSVEFILQDLVFKLFYQCKAGNPGAK